MQVGRHAYLSKGLDRVGVDEFATVFFEQSRGRQVTEVSAAVQRGANNVELMHCESSLSVSSSSEGQQCLISTDMFCGARAAPSATSAK